MSNPWTDPTPPPIPEWMTAEIKAELESNKLPLTNDGALQAWKLLKDKLDFFKEKEMEYRKLCAGFLVPEKTEGTTNVPLDNGFVAKVVTKYNYKPKDDNDAIWAGLEKIEKLGNDGPFVAKRLFSWQPSFLKSEYTQLIEDAEKGSPFAIAALKIINDELIVITDAAPTLNIVEPKKKK